MRFTWWLWARDDQILPDGNWFKLLACCGRAWGKTMFGSQAVVQRAQDEPGTVMALVGRSLKSVRRVMIENPKSGLLAISPPWFPATYRKTDSEVHWPNGSKALIFASEEPEPIRGNEFSLAWLDELCAFKYLNETWHIILPCMRLGPKPQIIVTTTPKNQKIIKELRDDPSVKQVRGGTRANLANLPKHVIEALYSEYKGTRLERQELEGEILDDMEGALWSGSQIDALRVSPHQVPRLVRVVVGCDPAITSSSWSDLTGIVVVGLGEDGHLYVLGDYSKKGKPEEWAARIFEAIENHFADCVVVETNRGGEAIEAILRYHAQAHGKILPNVKTLNSQEGKAGRAEPISALSTQGRVHHVGTHGELEDEQTGWVPFPVSDAGETQTKQKSPNRLDAYVFACTELKPNMAAYSPGVMVTPTPPENQLAAKVAARQSYTPRTESREPQRRSRWR